MHSAAVRARPMLLTGVNPAREDCATAIVATGICGRVGVALLAAAVLGCPPELPAIGLQAPAPEHADRAVRPQDDLFGHVNGPWLAATVIPPERVSTSAFAEISDRVDLDLRAIIEETAAAPRRRRGSTAQQVGDLYASLIDEGRIEALGLDPIRPQLDRIYGARTPAEFAAESGRVAAIGGGGPFDGAVDADERGQLVVKLSQSGILLPHRDYYLTDAPAYVRFRAGYVAYLTRIFELSGRVQAPGEAQAVLALETELARAQWDQADSRDPLRTANRMAFDELPRAFPGFDWREWARPQGIDRLHTVVIAEPSFFKRFAELTASIPLDTWKAWLAARYLTWSAPYISRAFSDARFDFFGRELSGQELPRERWRRAVSLVSGYLGDAVGRLYVERHFPASSKQRVERIVSRLVEAFREAIEGSDWMAPATKRRALQKLSRLTVKIGYPQSWRSYHGLEIRPDDLLGNIQRAMQFQNVERVARARSAAPLEHWLVTPQTVNAYYSPALNELIATAALLQPPLFDPDADDAVNFGAIGAIVGHEIAHGFDDRGRFFDGSGAVRDWWTPDDEAAFARRAALLVEQFNEYSPAPGLRVDGRLTLSENIGDLAGLSIAFRAYRLSLRGQPSPVVAGATGEQRFFLAWARAWRGKLRDDYMRQWLLSSPHAPPQYRANGPVSNMDGFHDAFGVGPGDRLFRQPDRRVRIW